MDKVCFIVNTNKKKKFNKVLKKSKINYNYNVEICDKDDVFQILEKNINKKYNVFVACGGDGTLNNLINCVMNLKESQRKGISISCLPLGKANDFATNYNLSTKNIEDLLKINKEKIPLIKVNNSYFITGGGFGFPAELVKIKERLENRKTFRYLFNIFNLYSYFLLVLIYIKSINTMPQYHFENQRQEKHLLFMVMNQQYIGKYFYFSPTSLPNSGINITHIEDKPTFIGRSKILTSIINKKKYEKQLLKDSFQIKFNENVDFMADGDILINDKFFDFKILKNEINFLINS